jgi:hypothetical protein
MTYICNHRMTYICNHRLLSENRKNRVFLKKNNWLMFEWVVWCSDQGRFHIWYMDVSRPRSVVRVCPCWCSASKKINLRGFVRARVPRMEERLKENSAFWLNSYAGHGPVGNPWAMNKAIGRIGLETKPSVKHRWLQDKGLDTNEEEAKSGVGRTRCGKLEPMTE